VCLPQQVVSTPAPSSSGDSPLQQRNAHQSMSATPGRLSPSPRKTPRHTPTRSTPSSDGMRHRGAVGASSVALHTSVPTALQAGNGAENPYTLTSAVSPVFGGVVTVAETSASGGGTPQRRSAVTFPTGRSSGDRGLSPGDASTAIEGADTAVRRKNVNPDMMKLLQEWKLEGEVDRLEARGVTSVEDLGCMTSEEVGLFGLPLRFRAMIRHINEDQRRRQSTPAKSPRDRRQEASALGGQTTNSNEMEGVTGRRATRRRQSWEQDDDTVSREGEHGPRRAGLLRDFDEAFGFSSSAMREQAHARRSAARNVHPPDLHRHTVHGYRSGVDLGSDGSRSSSGANAKGTPMVGTRAILPHTWGGDSSSSRGHSPVSIFPKALFNHDHGQGLQQMGQVPQPIDNGSSPHAMHAQQQASQPGGTETRSVTSVQRSAVVQREADLLEKVLVFIFFAILVFALGAMVDVEKIGEGWVLLDGMEKLANASAFERGPPHATPTAAGEPTTAAAAAALAAAAAAARIEDALESARAAGVEAGQVELRTFKDMRSEFPLPPPLPPAPAPPPPFPPQPHDSVAAVESTEAQTHDAGTRTSDAATLESNPATVESANPETKSMSQGHGRGRLVAAAVKGVKYTVRGSLGLAALVLLDKAIFA